jgi:uncharacterized RDD family membrane protein YckC
MSASTHRGIGDRVREVLDKDIVASGRLGRITASLILRISARLADWFLLYMTCHYLPLWVGVSLTFGYLLWSVRRYEGVTFAQHQFGVMLVNRKGDVACVTQALLRQATAIFVFLWLNHTITWGDTIIWWLFVANTLSVFDPTQRALLDRLLNTEVYVTRRRRGCCEGLDPDKLVTAPWRLTMAMVFDWSVVGVGWVIAGWLGVGMGFVCVIWSLYRRNGRTPGHHLCRLEMVDLNGQQLSFEHALGHEFGFKYLSPETAESLATMGIDCRAQGVTPQSLTAAIRAAK